MLFKYLKMRGQLSPTQKKFLQTLELEGSFKISSLLKELGFLGKMDAANDKARKTLGLRFVFSLLAAFIFPFALVHVSIVLLLITDITLIAFAIVCGIFWLILKKDDIDNDLRLFTLPFLGILKEEMYEKGKVSLSICCKDSFHKSFQFDEKKLPPRSNGVVTDHRTIIFYKHAPLKGKVTFSDQTDFTFEYTDLSQKIKIRKVRGGKTKFKFKYKKSIKLNFCLTFSKSTYSLNVENSHKIPLVITENDQSIIVKGKLMFKGLQKDGAAPFNPCINAIQQMYKAVKPL